MSRIISLRQRHSKAEDKGKRSKDRPIGTRLAVRSRKLAIRESCTFLVEEHCLFVPNKVRDHRHRNAEAMFCRTLRQCEFFVSG